MWKFIARIGELLASPLIRRCAFLQERCFQLESANRTLQTELEETKKQAQHDQQAKEVVLQEQTLQIETLTHKFDSLKDCRFDPIAGVFVAPGPKFFCPVCAHETPPKMVQLQEYKKYGGLAFFCAVCRFNSED